MPKTNPPESSSSARAGQANAQHTHGVRPQQWLTFRDARTFVHALNFKSYQEWRAYIHGPARAKDIPTVPTRTYAS